jgi:hypothetical protein
MFEYKFSEFFDIFKFVFKYTYEPKRHLYGLASTLPKLINHTTCIYNDREGNRYKSYNAWSLIIILRINTN